jgi:hypothetical protein
MAIQRLLRLEISGLTVYGSRFCNTDLRDVLNIVK